jgi:hypothetical protein
MLGLARFWPRALPARQKNKYSNTQKGIRKALKKHQNHGGRCGLPGLLTATSSHRSVHAFFAHVAFAPAALQREPSKTGRDNFILFDNIMISLSKIMIFGPHFFK